MRTYGTGADKKELVEFGGVIQLEILKVGVYAIGILSPEPFSLVLVMGVRFPTAIELTLRIHLQRRRRHPGHQPPSRQRRAHRGNEDATSSTGFSSPTTRSPRRPKILDQVAHVFPPADGGFVVGPIIELGWGSQAKIVEAKLGRDPRPARPEDHHPRERCGFARPRRSRRSPTSGARCTARSPPTVCCSSPRCATRRSPASPCSGDLGLLIQWGGGGDFALSVGGFNPRYKEAPPPLKDLERLTMDLSPPAVVKIIIKAYFAVTAGAVMAGVRGDLNADVGVASAHAWLQLDMIFYWVPRFGFAIDLDLGIEIEVFGCSFASITFTGALEGTTPWKIEGKATVDVWFLPTFHLDLGPYHVGRQPAADRGAEEPAVSRHRRP